MQYQIIYAVLVVPSTTSAGNVKPAWKRLSIRASTNRAMRPGVLFSSSTTLCCSASSSFSSSSSITNCGCASLSTQSTSVSSFSSHSQRVDSDSSSQIIGSTRAITRAQFRTDLTSSDGEMPPHGERGREGSAKEDEVGRGKVGERMRRINCVARTVNSVRIFSGYCCKAVLTIIAANSQRSVKKRITRTCHAEG